LTATLPVRRWRATAVKARYDPTNLIHRNLNIRPEPTA
jgi:hypothetical protein